ncbi:MAG: aminotransferase class III-fold pyridoxal phosphate-dependent enzyme, partial [Pseudomonadota bacterium]
GGEADMYAMRLARAFTGRDKIVKFEGGYHGMCAEAQMSLAPQALINFPQAVPDSAGIPASVRDEMLIAPFNDFEFIRSLVSEYADQIAGIIVEPLQRVIPPAPGFLELLREECDRHGIVLIFDEVVTGFRFDYGGAQAHYGVTPDLASLGKIIGGGFPLAAVAGRADIMAHFDKAAVGEAGFLMQVGTLSGNPVASVAGLKTLEILRREGQYQRLYDLGRRLMDGISDALSDAGHPHRIVGHETLFDVVFTPDDVSNYRDVFRADAGKAGRITSLLRERGVFKSAGKLYPSLALSDEDIELTLNAYREAAKLLS